MEEISDAPAPSRHIPRAGRRGRIALAVALVVLVALVGLWIARRPIATGVIDRELARRGVPVRYGIADLGFGGQRLTNVVIGDPAHPDLVADWIETRTRIGTAGASLTGLRAGHVRVRGRIVGGRLSLGVLDRFMGAPSGKPFALPAIDLAVEDGRMRLETPQGVVGVKLSGGGRLDDGFAGEVAAISPRLSAGGCVADRVAAAMRVRIAGGRPRLDGPVRAGTLTCAGTTVARVATTIDATLAPALDGWRGEARLATGAIRHPAAAAERLAGTIRFAGTAVETAGDVVLSGTDLRTAPGRVRSIALTGGYRIGSRTMFAGSVRAGGGVVAPATLARAVTWRTSGAGTPVAPLADRLARAITAAGSDIAVDADVALHVEGVGGTLRVGRLVLASASGARVALDGGSGLTVGWPGDRIRLDASLATGGGGLPDARVTLAQTAPGAPIRGTARIAPYEGGGARLSLTPVTFGATPGGATRVATRVTLSGPVGDGRVEALTMPVSAFWNGAGRLVVDTACAPLSFDRVAVSGLVLDRGGVTLCPVDGALLRLDGGRVGGGARIADARLAGRLGSTPVAVAATGATLRLADRGFVIDGLATRIGPPDRRTRIDAATLTGRLTGGDLSGTFAGAAGQIGAVPLLLSGADGRWTFARGMLKLAGALSVADAAADPRFRPLAGRDVALVLANGDILATATLATPDTGRKVADVRITHALASGTGDATITVPGIVFDKDFQPDRLTRLTFGVIADVRGSIDGSGHIAWTPAGVTSTGTFRTAGTDLAAAFGPVTGIAGSIAFTDLLSLRSAPGQVAIVKTINPGIPVTDGVIRYQTLPDARVQVEGARWPFAGGTLTLDPTLLDFSQAAERRMTFRVDHVAADQFLQQFDFKNLDATGIFDGVLPMVFDASGGRIEGGHLTVRPGGGTIRYVGDLSQKDLGLWANIAFQALKSLRYRSLGLVMNGPLAGEMVTEVKFAGISQGEGAKSNFLIRRLQRLPFVFNIRIRAPFRGLLDSAQSFYDPKRLIQRNLPALLDRQSAAPPIQPPASRTVP